MDEKLIDLATQVYAISHDLGPGHDPFSDEGDVDRVEKIRDAIEAHLVAELRQLAVGIGPQEGVVDGSDDMTRRACAADLLARAEAIEAMA